MTGDDGVVDRWLSCINCDTEWDDPDALGDFDTFTDCPECQGGHVLTVVRLTEEERERVDAMLEGGDDGD